MMSAIYLTYYVLNLARMEREILYLVKKTAYFLTFIFQKLFSEILRSGSVFFSYGVVRSRFKRMNCGLQKYKIEFSEVTMESFINKI